MTTRSVLELRAHLRRSLREVFDAAGYLEVDTPVLAAEVLPESHIEPVAVRLAGDRPPRWLQASPENLMKRLLAAGSGSIYQFAPAFRDGERGPWHDIEFQMLEWYAPAATLDDAAELLEQLCRAALGTRGLDRLSCSAAFGDHAGVDPLLASAAELQAAVERLGLVRPDGLETLPEADLFDRCFELLLAEAVQPRLGHGRPAMLESWPASQAAFARLDQARPLLAHRFELFVDGVELANGWEEDPSRELLAERITAANEIRRRDGRAVLPVPEKLLAAHGEAMPAGVGAALGFDRLAMLAAGTTSIDDVRCFPDGG
jgi:lysyl-tRNA synthetase class 2